MTARRSHLEELLALQIRAAGLPEPKREYRFDSRRRWRFDFAWPGRRVAIEVDGGLWMRGRHVRPEGYRRDAEKLNAAALAGWTVLRVTAGMVRRGEAVELVRKALGEDGESAHSSEQSCEGTRSSLKSAWITLSI